MLLAKPMPAPPATREVTASAFTRPKPASWSRLMRVRVCE